MALSAESRALRRSNAVFKKGVNPDDLVTELYSNLFLTQDEKAKATQKTLTPGEKCEVIFEALERRVSADPACLKTLIETLKGEPATVSVGDKIQALYDEETGAGKSAVNMASQSSDPPAEGRTLDIDDLFDLLGVLSEVAAKWKQIGLALRLRPGQLEVIDKEKRGQVDDCLAEALTLWLNMDYDTKKYGDPSWELLAEAVGHPRGGNNRALAQKITKEHGGTPTASATTGGTTGGTTAVSQPAAATTKTLDINKDVRKVKKLLKPLDKEQLKELFEELGLADATLRNKYAGETTAYADDLIRAWVQGRDDVLKSEDYPGGPTWENLKKALEELGHNGIADSITS